MRFFAFFLALTALLALAACGGADSNGDDDGEAGRDTLTIESQPQASDTTDIRDELLTPSTLRDSRIEQLTDAERRVLQDYVNRGVRRDSLEAPGSRRALGGWLDSNLTVGEVIALYRNVERIEPVSPEPLAQPSQQVPTRRSQER